MIVVVDDNDDDTVTPMRERAVVAVVDNDTVGAVATAVMSTAESQCSSY